MNTDILELAKIELKGDEWDKLYTEDPEAADALHYLLLLQKHGGRDAVDSSKIRANVSEKIAEEMGCTVLTLIAKKRKWTNNEALIRARDFLAPIRAEQDMILADLVMDAWGEIVLGILDKTLKADTIYAKLSGAQFLKTEIIAPAKAKMLPSDTKDADYLNEIKKQEALDEESRYLQQNGGE